MTPSTTTPTSASTTMPGVIVLLSQGAPLAQASALGLMLRLMINLVHIGLWLLVVAVLWLRGRRA